MNKRRYRACIAFASLLLSAATAAAQTYKMPVGNADTVFKIWVEGGQARRVGKDGDVTMYEVTMKDDRCITEVAVQQKGPHSPTLRMSYNVCWENGFRLTW